MLIITATSSYYQILVCILLGPRLSLNSLMGRRVKGAGGEKELTELEGGEWSGGVVRGEWSGGGGDKCRSGILGPCTSESALFKTDKDGCLEDSGWSKVFQGACMNKKLGCS